MTVITSRGIRQENKKNIIQSLLRSRDMLRSDLAAENHITVMTVKNIVDELLCDGIVEEAALSTTIGRKPHALHIVPRFGTIACISMTSRDYGVYMIFDIYGTVLERRQIVFDQQFSYQDNLDMLCDQLQNDLSRHSQECIGIGVTVASVYYEDEDITNFDLIPEFRTLHPAAYFRQRLHVQNIKVVHDVFSAAQAEYDIAKVNNLFFFFAGYGVGGAHIYNNEWHTGADHLAGEVGQCLIPCDGGIERLEDLVSLPAIMKKIRRVHPNITLYEAFYLYEKNDPFITEVLHSAAEQIAFVLHNIIWVLNPERIVIGSDFVKYASLIAEVCRKRNYPSKENGLQARVVVEPAQVKDGELRGCFKIVLAQWVDSLVYQAES